MDIEDAKKAAAAYRRAKLSWETIGKIVGVDRRRIRDALRSEGLDDGWGDGSTWRNDADLDNHEKRRR